MSVTAFTGFTATSFGPRHASPLPSWLTSVATIGIAMTALTILVPPTLSAVASSTPDTVRPVAVSLLGEISTSGLPARSAVSRLRIRNDGAGAIAWSVIAGATGAGAAGVVVTAWVPVAGSCTSTGARLRPADWSATPIAAGSIADLCVLVMSTGRSTASAAPFVTVNARPS
jgi:hypothetical protein